MEEITDRCFVYVYTFPNGKVYVGISKDVAMRHRKHMEDARQRPRGLVHRMFIKYGVIGKILPTTVFEGTRAECQAHEVELIRVHRSNVCEWGEDANGYNTTPGGEDQYHSHKAGKTLKQLLSTVPEFQDWASYRKKPKRKLQPRPQPQ